MKDGAVNSLGSNDSGKQAIVLSYSNASNPRLAGQVPPIFFISVIRLEETRQKRLELMLVEMRSSSD